MSARAKAPVRLAVLVALVLPMGEASASSPPVSHREPTLPDGLPIPESGDGDGGSGEDPGDPGDPPSPLDSDGDLLSDDLELAAGLLPFDADSDDDGVLDGIEGFIDTDADGLIDALDPDSDDDGLLDGVEAGITLDLVHPDTDATSPSFAADADPRVTTDRLDGDTDDDGLGDGEEDLDGDGARVLHETDPGRFDSDGDGLGDGMELGVGQKAASGTDYAVFAADRDPGSLTDPLDADTDDDGIPDGVEDADRDGRVSALETDPVSMDSDGDGIPDSVELGLFEPMGLDTDPALFVADADPATMTDPTNPDTDGDGIPDGVEDANANGALDAGETSPVMPSLDSGLSPDPSAPEVVSDALYLGDYDGACSAAPGGRPGTVGLLALLLATALRRRR